MQSGIKPSCNMQEPSLLIYRPNMHDLRIEVIAYLLRNEEAQEFLRRKPHVYYAL